MSLSTAVTFEENLLQVLGEIRDELRTSHELTRAVFEYNKQQTAEAKTQQDQIFKTLTGAGHAAGFAAGAAIADAEREAAPSRAPGDGPARPPHRHRPRGTNV